MTYLEHINGPQDLKGLSQEQLSILASEIRDVLVETVTRTSGRRPCPSRSRGTARAR